MKNPNIKFGIQFAINYLVWNILLGIAGRLIALSATSILSVEGLNICYVIIFPVEICAILAIIFSVFMTQSSLGKKELLPSDNLNVFYIILAVVLILFSVVTSILSYSYICSICERNISILSLTNDLMDNKSVTYDEASRLAVEMIHNTVMKALIFADVFLVLVITALIPVFKKRHRAKALSYS